MRYNLNGTVRRTTAVVLLAGATSFTSACGVSPQKEAEIGAQYSAQVNRELPILNDATANRYLNTIGQRLARNVNRKFNYRFYIVNTSTVNAFALPGGYVYINRGIIERADNASELAGVLAHEIAHVELRHGAEQMERMQAANVGVGLLYALTGRQPGGVERTGVNAVGSLYFAKHGREAEAEADATAINLMIAAGYHPRGLPTFFEELIAERKRRPSSLEQWFSTHPLTEERVAATQSLIARVPATRLRGLTTDTREFQSFRSRVRSLPRPRQ